MKKLLFLVVGVLVVIGGLIFVFNYNQGSSRGHSGTVSSQKVKTASSNKSAAASSSQSSASSLSVPVSNQQTSSSSSGSTSTNSSAGTADQALNRPQGAWVKDFEKKLYQVYHRTPSQYKYIGYGYWGVWVKEIDTGQFPYVTVDQNGTINPSVSRPQGDWVKTFENNLYQGYHVTPSRYVYIGRGYWEVWVKEINTGQYPYVTVNQYTGNFHG